MPISQFRKYLPELNYRNMHTAAELGQAVGKKVAKYKRDQRGPFRLQPHAGPARRTVKKDGAYRGRFNKVRKNKASREDKSLTTGCGTLFESYGQVKGTDTVWVGASTLEITKLANVVSQAILRKLLKKGGIEVTSADINLNVNPATSNHALGWAFQLTSSNSAGTQNVTLYDSTTTETLATLASASGLRDSIIEYASGTNEYIVTEIDMMLVYPDPNLVRRTVASINLRNEYVNVHMNGKLVVQNRTLTAAGASSAVDSVDAQSLKGKIYYFKKSQPEVRISNGKNSVPNTDSLLGRWTNTNLRLVSSDSSGYDNSIKEPPSPYFFSNCSKSSNIRLESGEIKEVNMNNNYKMFYPQFVQRLSWYSGTGVRRQKVGDSVYVCLEETLNSGSANKITVNYEFENKLSCYLTAGKVAPMNKTYSEQEVNLV